MNTITCTNCNRTHEAEFAFTSAASGTRMYKATCTDGLADIYAEREVELAR